MNLKTAALRLGVSYQTVYRYVRSGELAAVRVGREYAVSDAAIEQFLARRRAMKGDAQNPVCETCRLRRGGFDLSAVMIEVESLVNSVSIDARSTLTNLTRAVTEAVGDGAALFLTDRSGQRLEVVACDHHDTRLVSSMAVFAQGLLQTTRGRSVVTQPTPELRQHARRDWLASLVGGEEFDALAKLDVSAWCSAPVVIEAEPIGALVVVRCSAAPPFAEGDVALIGAAARGAGRARQIARLCRAAWKERSRFAAWVADHRGALPPLPDSPFGLMVFGLDGEVLALNAAMATRVGDAARDLIGARLSEVLPAEVADDERDRFERLASGERAFDDARFVLVDPRLGPTPCCAHRAVVRADDARPVAIVSVIHDLDLPAS